MDHVYWIAPCKSEDCVAYHLASYIGYVEWTANFALPNGLPQSWDHRCNQCGIVHSYSPSDLIAYTQGDGTPTRLDSVVHISANKEQPRILDANVMEPDSRNSAPSNAAEPFCGPRRLARVWGCWNCDERS